MFAATRTLSPFWVQVTVPVARLPWVGCRLAFAPGPPPDSIIAHPASRLATVTVAMPNLIASSVGRRRAGRSVIATPLLPGGSLGRRRQPSDPLVLAIVSGGPVLRLAEHLCVLLRRVVRLLLGFRRLC